MATGTKFYSLKLSLDASSGQPELIQLFKSNGDDVIQTSDGLCVKTTRSLSEMKSLLEEKDLSRGIALQSLNPGELRDQKDAAQDLRVFVGV